MNKNIIRSHLHRGKGFTLLEVMVAMVIFSIGLLGLAGLQARGLHSNVTAEFRTVATLQAYDMADRIRANPRGRTDGNYGGGAMNNTSPAAANCVTAACDAATMATFDYFEWETNNQNLLPGGHGIVTAAGGRFTIIVMWDEDRTGVNGQACSGDSTVDLKCYTLVIEP